MDLRQTSFRDWTLQTLEDTFRLREDRSHAPMAEWLEAEPNVDLTTQSELNKLRQSLDRHARGWNEEELKILFIGPLLRLVDFDGENYGIFADRMLSATVESCVLSGVADALVARGRHEPVTPYFCLQEYKPEKGREVDPAAQVLAAMLTARELNPTKHTIYGAYVIGRFWFFLTLDGQDPVYSISRSFDASSDDIVSVFGLLQRLKFVVAEFLRSAA